jgi:hypothetical protein
MRIRHQYNHCMRRVPRKGEQTPKIGDGMMPWPTYKLGDPVIFCVTKHSRRPGRRAKSIHPAPHGDDYTYQVDKFWVVAAILDDGKLLLRTRRGKTHDVKVNDPNLRHATWWERLWYGDRFPQAS